MSDETFAKEYLDYYLDKDGDPDFAVMLEGPWGSGKSFFYDRYFRDRHAATLKTDPQAKPEIRVSLFGVRELGEITSQIFAKAHPWLGGKTARVVNAVGSKIASAFGVSTDPKENQKLMEEMLVNLEGRVLVFDDFERCPLPVVEAMGFINQFVEQDKLKVIVVACEDEITEREEYDERKEKLIGKTIRVGSDPAVALDAFAATLTCAEARDAIAANRESLLSTFAAPGKPNLRSLRAILHDFDRIVGLADPALRSSKEGLAALLLYLVAIGLEFRAGAIDVEGLRTLGLDMAMRLNLDVGKDKPHRIRAAEIRARYPAVKWSNPIIPADMLGELFASGTVDVARLNERIATHPLIAGLSHVPEWRAMWEWYDLGATDYSKVRGRFEGQLKSRALVHPGELLHAAGTSIRLQGYGDDLLGADPVAYFTQYIADLDKSGTLTAAPELFGPGAGSHGGLVYNEDDSPEFRQIYRLVEGAAGRAMARRLRTEAPALLTRLAASPDEWNALHEHGLREGKYGGVAILAHIPVADIANLLLVDGKFENRLMAALGNRYAQAFGLPSLDPERSWVADLHAELDQRIGTLLPPFRLLAERRLATWYADVKKWAVPPKPVPSKPVATRKAAPRAKALPKSVAPSKTPGQTTTSMKRPKEKKAASPKRTANAQLRKPGKR